MRTRKHSEEDRNVSCNAMWSWTDLSFLNFCSFERITHLFLCVQADRVHLHSLSLVRSCIQKAVGLLRDPDSVPSRGMQRMHILLTALGSDQRHTGGNRLMLLFFVCYYCLTTESESELSECLTVPYVQCSCTSMIKLLFVSKLISRGRCWVGWLRLWHREKKGWLLLKSGSAPRPRNARPYRKVEH